MKMMLIEGEKMKRIVGKSSSAELVALSLSLRERLRQSINIDRLRLLLRRQGQNVVQAEYIQFWKDIEAEGLGYLSIGRMRNPSVFYFACDPRKIGKAGISGMDEQAAYTVTNLTRKVIRKNDMRRTHHVLRPSSTSMDNEYIKPFRFSIEVPGSLTDEELKTLFITLKRMTNNKNQ